MCEALLEFPEGWGGGGGGCLKKTTPRGGGGWWLRGGGGGGGGGGVLKKNPFRGEGMDIFWNYTCFQPDCIWFSMAGKTI